MDNTEWPTVFLNLFNSKQGGGVGEGGAVNTNREIEAQRDR